MASESRLQSLCNERILGYLESRGYSNLSVEQEAPIIMDSTFVPEADGFTPYLGRHKVDIAVFFGPDELSQPVSGFEFSDAKEGQIRIPLIAIETKHSNPGTEEIRSKAYVAHEMKEIFPLLRYYLMMDKSSLTSMKTYRAGKHFDAFFITEDTADKEWIRENVIANGVEPHLRRLRRLDVL